MWDFVRYCHGLRHSAVNSIFYAKMIMKELCF